VAPADFGACSQASKPVQEIGLGEPQGPWSRTPQERKKEMEVIKTTGKNWDNELVNPC
jgi:hypothetical protein